MGEPVAIYILGTPTDVQRQMFRAAKHRLGVKEPLKFAAAFPGCGRLISFEDKPEFFCDYALVRSERQDSIQQVLDWYLGHFDRRAHTGIEWLTQAVGGHVKEVTNEA